MNTVRKNITLSLETYNIINGYAKKNGVSFSEFLRNAALQSIEQSEQTSLLDYISKNCDYMDADEQDYIDNLHLDFDLSDGKELTLDEILQD